MESSSPPQLTLNRYATRLWVAVLLAANIYFLALFSSFLPYTVTMLVVGTVLVYFLLVPITWLEKIIIKGGQFFKSSYPNFPLTLPSINRRALRFVVLTITYLIGLWLLTLTLTHVVPVLRQETLDFFKQLPEIFAGLQFQVEGWLKQLGVSFPALKPVIQNIPFMGSNGTVQNINLSLSDKNMTLFMEWVQARIMDSTSFINSGISKLMWVVLLLVYVFYALLDGQDVLQDVYKRFSPSLRDHCQQFTSDLHNIMLAFIKGQVLLGLLTGVYMFIIYSIFGVEYALLLSSVFAVSELLPIVGTYIGFTPGILLIALTGDFGTLLAVFACSYVWQSVKDNILQPQIFGNALGLHPVVILLALIICGKLGGLIGVLLAVPVSALIVVTMRRLKSFQPCVDNGESHDASN